MNEVEEKRNWKELVGCGIDLRNKKVEGEKQMNTYIPNGEKSARHCKDGLLKWRYFREDDAGELEEVSTIQRFRRKNT